MTVKYDNEETLIAIERTQTILGNLHQHVIEMSNPETDTEYLDKSYEWMENLVNEFARSDGKPLFTIRFKGTDEIIEFSFGINLYSRNED